MGGCAAWVGCVGGRAVLTTTMEMQHWVAVPVLYSSFALIRDGKNLLRYTWGGWVGGQAVEWQWNLSLHAVKL